MKRSPLGRRWLLRAFGAGLVLAAGVLAPARPAAAHTGDASGPTNFETGRYRPSIEFPRAGDWTVRFTSVTPRATLEHSQPVTDDATTGATDGSPDATTGPSTTLPPSTINLVEETPDSNEAGTGWIVFAGVIFALAVIGALIVRASQRARP